MRRLVSQEEREKKRKRNQITIGIILGIVLVMSTLGFALQGALSNNANSGSSSGQGTFSYNGFQFTNSNGVWILGNFVFQNSPADVENLSSAVIGTLNDAKSYQNAPLYIYSEDTTARIEAYANMGNIAQRVQDACPAGANCTENVPLKTCADNFIIIKASNNSLGGSIKQDKGCVYIVGPKKDLVRLTDEFLYKILGVN